MYRVKIVWKKSCIYFVIILITTIMLCLLLFNTDVIPETDHSSSSIVLAPLKDSLDRKRMVKKLISNNVVLKQNNSLAERVPRIPKNSGSPEAVIQIDKHILTLIEEFEQTDTSVKGKVQLEGVKNYTCPPKPRFVNGVEDLLCMKPPKYLPNYKNPCWNSSDGKFHCLPYFQVIGIDKSGSTDLFDRIAKHPDVLKNNGVLQKETLWWSWKRYGHWLKGGTKIEPFSRYVQYFDTAAKAIQQQPSSGIITGDGTPLDIWDTSGWVHIPQNKGLKDPEYITPHLVKHVNPNVKLVVILRDPVERLFSDYFFLKVGKMTTRAFHDEVITAIKLLHVCTRKSTLRTCLYTRSIHVKVNARIHVGFYSIFLKDWLKVFPREQILILKTEDYSNSTVKSLLQVFNFLGLRIPPRSVVEQFASTKRGYVTQSKKKAGNMLPQTRAILERLYKKFSKELAEILNEKRFLWEHPF